MPRRIHKIMILNSEHRTRPVMRKQLEIIIKIHIITYRHKTRTGYINPTTTRVAKYHITSYFHPPSLRCAIKRALLLVA